MRKKSTSSDAVESHANQQGRLNSPVQQPWGAKPYLRNDLVKPDGSILIVSTDQNLSIRVAELFAPSIPQTNVIYTPETRPLLNIITVRLLGEIVNFIYVVEKRLQITVIQTIVTRLTVANEGIDELIVRVKVKASPELAMAFWEDLSHTIDIYSSSLNDEDRETLNRKIGTDVVW